MTTTTNIDSEPTFGFLTKKRKRKWPHMIENVIEKIIRVNRITDPPPPDPRKIARMNDLPPIDEVMLLENDNENDYFSNVCDEDERSGFGIECFV